MSEEELQQLRRLGLIAVNRYLSRLVGKRVRCLCVDGLEVEGTLLAYSLASPFTIVIKDFGGNVHVINWHRVFTLAELGEDLKARGTTDT